jgi:hypothetical protein
MRFIVADNFTEVQHIMNYTKIPNRPQLICNRKACRQRQTELACQYAERIHVEGSGQAGNVTALSDQCFKANHFTSGSHIKKGKRLKPE